MPSQAINLRKVSECQAMRENNSTAGQRESHTKPLTYHAAQSCGRQRRQGRWQGRCLKEKHFNIKIVIKVLGETDKKKKPWIFLKKWPSFVIAPWKLIKHERLLHCTLIQLCQAYLKNNNNPLLSIISPTCHYNQNYYIY